MVERLLLDRIDAEAGRAAVAGQLHALAVLARAPDEAQAPLPGAHVAEARTEPAFDPPVLELRPILDVDAVAVHASPAAFARPLLRNRPICRNRERGLQCGALARRRARAYICRQADGDRFDHDILGAEMLNDVHPAQVAGLFYPAGAQSLRDLIRQMGKGARPDGGVAPKVVVAPHAGIVYSGSVAATAFGPWARRRRSAPPHRHRRPGAPGRLPRARDPSGDGLEHAARRGEDRARSPRPPCGSKGGGGRRAAVRRRAFARNAPRDAAGDADGAVRNPADPRRRRRAAAGRRGAAARLGRPGDRDRRLVRSVALPRPGERRGNRLRHRPADREARRRTRSKAGGPAAICRSWGRWRSPRNGT